MDVVIAVYCDELYVPHMATMIRSVLKSVPKDLVIRLFVLHSGVSNEVLQKAMASWDKARVVSTWCYIDLSYYGFASHAHITADSLSRLLVGRFIPAQYHRAILLDSDIIVLESIDEIWRLDMGNHIAMAAVNQDLPVTSMVRSPLLDSAGIAPFCPYFNAGVMLVDLDRWRGRGVENHALALFAKRFNMARFGDQCILNVVLNGCWGEIHPRWNVQLGDPPYSGETPGAVPTIKQISAARIRPAIAHYTGETKPWHVGCNLMHRELYHEHRSQTAFSETLI